MASKLCPETLASFIFHLKPATGFFADVDKAVRWLFKAVLHKQHPNQLSYPRNHMKEAALAAAALALAP